jgi:hypothetical protein
MNRTTAEKSRKSNMARRIIVGLLCPVVASAASLEGSLVAGIEIARPVVRLSKLEYEEKVYASWPGQIVGNIYGLSYEFRFIDEPGPDEFPYGYGVSLERVREVGRAISRFVFTAKTWPGKRP